MIFTGFRLPEDLLKTAKARAASQHRSFGNYLLHLICLDIDGAASEKKEKKIDRLLPPAGLG